MAFNINSSPIPILGTTGTTSTGAGNWFRVHPDRRNLTFQLVGSAAAAGTTINSTVYIQGSNDGVNPLQTTAGTSVDALATMVIAGGSPQSNGFAMVSGWEWVRAFVNSISTGSVQVNVASQQGK